MTKLTRVIAIILFLWSARIGDEEIPNGPESSKPNATTPVSRSNGSQDKTGKLDPKALHIHSKVKIDQKRFIEQFAKQAIALDLRHCLKTTLKQPEGALAVAAELEKNGQLINVRIIDSEKKLPECAIESISSMNFQKLAPPIEGAEHTIYWRIDW